MTKPNDGIAIVLSLLILFGIIGFLLVRCFCCRSAAAHDRDDTTDQNGYVYVYPYGYAVDASTGMDLVVPPRVYYPHVAGWDTPPEGGDVAGWDAPAGSSVASWAPEVRSWRYVPSGYYYAHPGQDD
ncbi:hypothetical protein RRF57_004826 [Xylaria bambusicola]|uniref:Uncharacterized protein n=1 Tax=Xylaria bambusicola TaxID=326684 RepID=A0AAN7UPG6_9PEZI